MTKRIERLRLRSVNRVGNAKWGAVHALLSVATCEPAGVAAVPATASSAGGRGKTSGRKKLIGNARAARKAAKRRPVAMAGR